jgi:hypothetical protein
MTRGEARRPDGPDVPGPKDGGPDPTEDPILYLQDLKEDEK